VQRKNENKIINSNYYEKNYHLGRHCIGGIKDVWGLKKREENQCDNWRSLKKNLLNLCARKTEGKVAN